MTHVLIEMTDERDCRLIGSWLIKAAEAQTLWSQALRNPDFENRLFGLCAFSVPDLECAALELLAALQQRHRVLASDLYEMEAGVFSIEFGMMVQLGFFLPGSQTYHLMVPESVTLEGVRQAALTVASTAEDTEDGPDIIQPERLLRTLPQTEAEARRSRLIEMRRFNTDVPRDRKMQ